MHSTGVGKVLLLDKSDEEINEIIKVRGLTKLTSRTIRSKQELVTELGKVRRRGYAIDDEECEEGVRCVAAPLRDYSGGVVAAISASGPVARMSKQRVEDIGEMIVDLGVKISMQLGYEPPPK